MSYKENLGRVKGDKGTSYIPKLVPQIENDVIKKYVIEWTSSDNSDIPEELQNMEFAAPVYVPHINSDGFVQFTLQTPSAYSFTSNVSIKGDKGDDGHIKTKTVNERPTGSDIDIDTIYVIGDNAYIWNQSITDYNDSEHGWVHLEDMIKFTDYYRKRETYGRYNKNIADGINDENEKQEYEISNTYSASYINDELGNTRTALQKIQSILNDGSINIQMP